MRAAATVIGPVGLALTISTCTRSGASAEPAPYSLPAATTSASASPNQVGASHRLRNPGGAVSARSIPGSAAAASARSAAISSGARFCAPASRSATLVA